MDTCTNSLSLSHTHTQTQTHHTHTHTNTRTHHTHTTHTHHTHHTHTPLLLTQSHTGIQTFYSTPSRYVDAVNQAHKTYTVKTDDFFPYADNPFAYWTGT